MRKILKETKLVNLTTEGLLVHTIQLVEESDVNYIHGGATFYGVQQTTSRRGDRNSSNVTQWSRQNTFVQPHFPEASYVRAIESRLEEGCFLIEFPERDESIDRQVLLHLPEPKLISTEEGKKLLETGEYLVKYIQSRGLEVWVLVNGLDHTTLEENSRVNRIDYPVGTYACRVTDPYSHGSSIEDMYLTNIPAVERMKILQEAMYPAPTAPYEEYSSKNSPLNEYFDTLILRKDHVHGQDGWYQFIK